MTDTSRAVVITGAAGDLGRALCDSFLADGFIVYGADRAARCRLVRALKR
jgi:NAD(P)-dependent dehydrogenase (short-subunit alcohol dehydrogenase family)